jgi:hypothetical protein
MRHTERKVAFLVLCALSLCTCAVALSSPFSTKPVERRLRNQSGAEDDGGNDLSSQCQGVVNKSLLNNTLTSSNVCASLNSRAGVLIMQNVTVMCGKNHVSYFRLGSNSILVIRDAVGLLAIESNDNIMLENVFVCVGNVTMGHLGVISEFGSAGISFVALTSQIIRHVLIVFETVEVVANVSIQLLKSNTTIPLLLSSLVRVTGEERAEEVRIVMSHTSVSPSAFLDQNGASLPAGLWSLPIVLSSLIVVSSPLTVDGVLIQIIQCAFHVKTATPGASFIAVLATELGSTPKFQSIRHVVVEIEDSVVAWHIDKDTAPIIALWNSAGSRVSNSFGVDQAYAGIVTVYTLGTNDRPVLNDQRTIIHNISLRALNVTAIMWLHGDFLPGSMYPNDTCVLCGTRPSLFSVVGNRYSTNRSHSLENATLVVASSTFRSRGCSTAVIFVYGFLQSILRGIFIFISGNSTRDSCPSVRAHPIVAFDGDPNGGLNSDFELFAVTPLKPSWTVLFSSIVRLAEVAITESKIVLTSMCCVRCQKR